jgi:DNA-binding transcriptional LysR family regulator
VIEQLFSAEGSASPHMNCIASVATMIRVVCDGLGVAAVPPAIIQRELAEQRLRLLRVDREFPRCRWWPAGATITRTRWPKPWCAPPKRWPRPLR